MSETISVTLPDETMRKIREQIENGAYASADQMMTEAVEAFIGLERDRYENFAWMKARVRQSLDDPRPSKPADEVFDRLEAKFGNMASGPAK